mmetsp:Transcript_25969/g.59767  ORF Transcript_25969/g.59767 Transcript_25969/m.59767 type:complete len:283 (-) Transcript_25969:1048-1896(-)
MPSKNAWSIYAERFKKVLARADPMVIFVKPASYFYDVVMKNRQHAPTLVVTMQFEELAMSTTFEDFFWEKQYTKDHEKVHHKGPSVYKIWHMKMLFIKNVSQLNPFRSNHVFWLDAGFIRSKTLRKTSFVQVDIAKAGVDPNKMLMFAIFQDPGYRKCEAGDYYFIGAGFLGGSALGIQNFCRAYWEAFWDMVTRDCFIGLEQFVMTEACRRHPEACHLQYPGVDKQWFFADGFMSNPEARFMSSVAISPLIDQNEAVESPPMGIVASNKPPYLKSLLNQKY